MISIRFINRIFIPCLMILILYQRQAISLPDAPIERLPLLIRSYGNYGSVEYKTAPGEGHASQYKDIFLKYQKPEQADYSMMADLYIFWRGPATVSVQIGVENDYVQNLMLDRKSHAELEATANQYGLNGFKMDPEMQVWHTTIPVYRDNMPFLRIISLVEKPTQLGLMVVGHERLPLLIRPHENYGSVEYTVPVRGQGWQFQDVVLKYERPEQADYSMMADLYVVWRGPAKVLVQIGVGDGDLRNLELVKKTSSELKATANRYGLNGVSQDSQMQIWYTRIPIYRNDMPFLRIRSLVDRPTQLGLMVIGNERMPLFIKLYRNMYFGLAKYDIQPIEGQTWQFKDVLLEYQRQRPADGRMIADIYVSWRGPATVFLQYGFGNGGLRSLVLDKKSPSEMEAIAQQYGLNGLKMDPDKQAWHAMIPVHQNNMPFLRIKSLVDRPTRLQVMVIERDTIAMYPPEMLLPSV